MADHEFDGDEIPVLPGEPDGWRELQKKARSAQTLKELDSILAQMNKLLTECEKNAEAGGAPHPAAQPNDKKHKSKDQ